MKFGMQAVRRGERRQGWLVGIKFAICLVRRSVLLQRGKLLLKFDGMHTGPESVVLNDRKLIMHLGDFSVACAF